MDGHAELIGASGLPETPGFEGPGDQGELFDHSRQFDTSGAPLMEPANLMESDRDGREVARIGNRNFLKAAGLPNLEAAERSQILDNCLRAQESERLKLGRELHDSTGQLLLALRLEIARLREVDGASGQCPLLDEIEETVREIDKEVRAFSFTRYPADVGADGLGPALRSLASGFAKRTGLRIDFKSNPNSLSQTGDVALALLRVAQEALLNVHRHAKALHVQVALIQRGGCLELTIRDDGIGIPGDRDLAESHGVGLPGMRHRIERLGGHFAIRRLKNGTKIVASVPA